MIGTVRPVIVAGNWKMNTAPAEAGDLAAAIARETDELGVVRVICPPFVSLDAVASALRGTAVHVGAQNVHHATGGAYTGEVAASMLRGLATWCIVGHSERRRDQGETDEQISRKLLRCRENGLRPILCVGEQLDERKDGRAEERVREQLLGAFDALGTHDPLLVGTEPTLVVAYEPVWAIGTGRTARGVDAAEIAHVIRQTLADLGASAGGEHVPVLYGGSVTSASVDEFLAEPAIDGALVGGASLRPDEMAGIVARAAITARARASVTTAAS
jgi:triosephosphate isomerase